MDSNNGKNKNSAGASKGIGVALVVIGIIGACTAPFSATETGEPAVLPTITIALISLVGGAMLMHSAKKKKTQPVSYDKKKHAGVKKGFGIALVVIGLIGASTAPSAKTETGEPAILSSLAIALICIVCGAMLIHSARHRKRASNNNHVSVSKADFCRNSIIAYLQTNKSTPFFREKLTEIAERFDAFDVRCSNTQRVIAKRFGPVGLSYDKFIAPVEDLQKHMLDMVDSLVARMHVFNEEEYHLRIDELMKTNRAKDAESYIAIEQEYKEYVKRTLSELDNAIIAIDRFILEISKLDETNADKAMDTLHNLENTIRDMQYYK